MLFKFWLINFNITSKYSDVTHKNKQMLWKNKKKC